MKSIRLSFNTAVARDILRRCWPLWVAYLVFLAFTFPVNLVSYLQEAGPALSADPVGRYTSHVLSLSIIQAQVAIGVAILTVMVLFGWMYNSRGNTLMNLLPIRREGVFTTLYLTGLIPLLLCQALVLLVTVPILRGAGVEIKYGLIWFASAALGVIAFYGFAVFCAMLTGNILVLPAVYLVLNLTAWVFESSVRSCLSGLVFGLTYTDLRFDFLSPFVKLTDTLKAGQTPEGIQILEGLPLLGRYALAGLILSVAALLLYRRRRMECVSDFVAIPALKPVFRFCMSLGSAAVLGAILCDSSLVRTASAQSAAWIIAGLLIGGAVIGWIAAEMMIQRSVRILPMPWKGLAAVCLLCVLTIVSARTDLTGFERRIPDPNRVESVEFWYNTELREEDNIRAVTELHREIVTERDRYAASPDDAVLPGSPAFPDPGAGENASPEQRVVEFSLPILYHMKDGGTMQRLYNVKFPAGDSDRPETLAGKILSVMNSREGIQNRMESFGPVNEENIRYASIIRITAEGDWQQNRLTPQETVELWTSAMIPDAKEEKLDLVTIEETPQSLSRQTNLLIEIAVSDEYSRGMGRSFQVYTTSERCLEWIDEHMKLEWETMDVITAAREAAGMDKA